MGILYGVFDTGFLNGDFKWGFKLGILNGDFEWGFCMGISLRSINGDFWGLCMGI